MKDEGIGRRCQKQNNPCGPADDLEEENENEIDSKPGKEEKKNGKGEGVEGEGKYFQWNSRREKEPDKDCVKKKKAGDIPQCDDCEKNKGHPDHLHRRRTPVEPAFSLDG